jgi:hypothetical protein
MNMTLREELVRALYRVSDDHLGQVASLLHHLQPGRNMDDVVQHRIVYRQPSPRLAHQGARLLADDMGPVLSPEHWLSVAECARGLVDEDRGDAT